MLTIRSARPEELRDAVRLALAEPESATADLKTQVQAFFGYVDPRHLRPESQVVVDDGSRLMTASICLEAPGRTAMIFPPSLRMHPKQQHWIAEAVREQLRLLGARGVVLVQCLIGPEQRANEAVLVETGFEFLAELIYLDRPVPESRKAPGTPQSTTQLRWESYHAGNHGLFLQTIEATYAASLDCPVLNGRRGMEDVLAGHKATGAFHASDWFVARWAGQPAGVLLLSQVPHQPAFEVVYVGVVPSVRGQGLGERLMQAAVEHARRRGMTQLTLAVDANNSPAIRLYQRLGFRETGRRRAWVAWL